MLLSVQYEAIHGTRARNMIKYILLYVMCSQTRKNKNLCTHCKGIEKPISIDKNTKMPLN